MMSTTEATKGDSRKATVVRKKEMQRLDYGQRWETLVSCKDTDL